MQQNEAKDRIIEQKDEEIEKSKSEIGRLKYLNHIKYGKELSKGGLKGLLRKLGH